MITIAKVKKTEAGLALEVPPEVCQTLELADGDVVLVIPTGPTQVTLAKFTPEEVAKLKKLTA